MRTEHPDLLKTKILELIQNQGPVTAQVIARQIPISVNDPIRVIRKKVRELILEEKIPIASSMNPPAGYFIAKQDASARRYVIQLKSRIYRISERLSAFEHSTAKQIQLLLIPSQEQEK
jgi:hypothetical protein